MSRTTQIQRLLPRHHKIIDLAVAGHEVEQIAEVVGMSAAAVKTILRSAVTQQEIALRRKASREDEVLGMDRDAYRGKAQSILEQATVKAAAKQVELLECGDPAIVLRAADKILDRVFGDGKDSRRSMVVNITASQVALLTTALKEADYERQAKPANSPDSEHSLLTESNVSETSGEDGSADISTADGSEDQSGDVLLQDRVDA